jgi:type IV secretory pathway VirB10-like protein
MSASYLDASHSPSELIEDPGSNVRRMNKLPVLILFTLCFLVLMTLIFAVFQRTQANVEETKAAKAEGIVSAFESIGSIFDNHKEGGIVPATPELFETNEQTISKIKNAYSEAFKTTEYADESFHSDTLPSVPPRSQYNTPVNPTNLRSKQLREDLFYDAVLADTGVQYAESIMRQPGAKKTNGYDSHDINQRIEEKRKRLVMANQAGSGLQGNGAYTQGDPNLWDRKAEFQSTTKKYGYSAEFRKPQLTPFELRVGTVIPAVLVTTINSDLPGEIIAQISQNVRDTKTGKYVLIPQGSKLIGTYDSQVAMGQTRAMIAWHRIQFPDSSTLALGGMGGTDQAGAAGFTDTVNNHYAKVFGNAALLSLISAASQLSQPDNGDGELTANQQLAAELGRNWGQVGQQMVKRNMNIQPTLEIRSGYRFNVMVNKDMIMQPYQPL